MTEEPRKLSYGRLLKRFAQIGPYLRKNKSSEEYYFFDCLSACINSSKSPECREFWGWWLELTRKEGGFEYIYTFGKFNTEGKWHAEDVPKRSTKEVEESLNGFYSKISGLIVDELQLGITAELSLKKPILGFTV
ncbi:sigma factor-binding protein Crl [Candidatus Enterovibrio escicola]|uniref:Sigma factor-binding protein Crl n=1 Tax=Candidatus Enterovibrio escicola TaxID=1927127 RepID=A0A2A5SZU2_9GAMM|nr:sigma factor-binding protein Crl [Candidatus Enterovibrio escacola]PCS21388.1 Curlin genes transcriptional activator [Candidatus Enterovibrio escacola]